MYAIRVTVTHSQLTQIMTGAQKSNYIVIVDTEDLTDAFTIANSAMKAKYKNRYHQSQFDFAGGAQKINGHLDDEEYKILFTN